ncbi:expressed protein [Echinococcus multilocularis]|uniref:Expressed protein n=1 Tax=Echinococcus multilocularis TaxID=6211 RepID=A0A068YG27_ECHMU|nr:expressed protein [Echinococcus multilocularis]
MNRGVSVIYDPTAPVIKFAPHQTKATEVSRCHLCHVSTPSASEKSPKGYLKYNECTLRQRDKSGSNFPLIHDSESSQLNVHRNQVKRGKVCRKEDVQGVLRHFTCKRKSQRSQYTVKCGSLRLKRFGDPMKNLQ